MTHRPPDRTIPIDRDEVGRLAGLGCSQPLIASILGVSEDTLRRRLKRDTELCEAVRAGGVPVKANLRAALLQRALAGNSRILIFLARAELGMSETAQKIELSGPDGAPIRTATDGGAAYAAATELLNKLTDAARARPDEQEQL